MGGRGERRSGRLFVAIEVPPSVHVAVDDAIRTWRDRIDARWVRPDARHVTLRFLGQVAVDEVADVRRAVVSAASTVGPVATQPRGLGAFPSIARARVLWAGIDDRAGRLAGVALALDAALSSSVSSRLAPQTGAFRPHLTVARCDPPVRLPAEYGGTEVEPVAFEVGAIVLFESVRGSGPPTYEALERADLRG
jgi:2'-5' RNA ligase